MSDLNEIALMVALKTQNSFAERNNLPKSTELEDDVKPYIIEFAESLLSELDHQRDEALRQVVVLREAVDAAAKFADRNGYHSTARGFADVLSEIPSPGVLCESEPVLFEHASGLITREDKDCRAGARTPLYRKKGESP